ncbi:MAG: hypothetical protein AB1815_04420 [Bacillota bacterium]
MGVRLQRKKEDVTDSVGLLISILVRYPEVATINYEPEKQILKFNFISVREIKEKEIKKISSLVLDSIEVFNFLEGRQTGVVALNYQVSEQLTLIEVQRDMDTLVQEEISLIVDLFRQHLQPSLVTEINESLIEEDMLIQEEIIDHMLESVRERAEEKYLYAFREEGRVLVFNK